MHEVHYLTSPPGAFRVAVAGRDYRKSFRDAPPAAYGFAFGRGGRENPPFYFLKGEVLTYEDLRRIGGHDTLLADMRGLGWPVAALGDGWCREFGGGDILLDRDGHIARRGFDADLTRYRHRFHADRCRNAL